MHPLYNVEKLSGKELMDAIDNVSNRLMIARRLNINYDTIIQLEEYLAILNLRAYEEACLTEDNITPVRFDIDDYLGKIDADQNNDAEQNDLFGW